MIAKIYCKHFIQLTLSPIKHLNNVESLNNFKGGVESFTTVLTYHFNFCIFSAVNKSVLD